MVTPKGWHNRGFPHGVPSQALLGFNPTLAAPVAGLEQTHPGPVGAGQGQPSPPAYLCPSSGREPQSRCAPRICG